MPETENFLSLIYRSYWAAEEEKEEFAKKDKEELQKALEEQDIQKIFENKRINKKNDEEVQLVPVKEKSILKKVLEKIKSFFIKNKD